MKKELLNNEKIVLIAKEFMKSYFADGKEKTPSDFDQDILGGVDIDIMFGHPPKWNRTPFFDALTELVEDGEVKFKVNDNGACIYWMESKEKSI
jgi:hypothetical protein